MSYVSGIIFWENASLFKDNVYSDISNKYIHTYFLKILLYKILHCFLFVALYNLCLLNKYACFDISNIVLNQSDNSSSIRTISISIKTYLQNPPKTISNCTS